MKKKISLLLIIIILSTSLQPGLAGKTIGESFSVDKLGFRPSLTLILKLTSNKNIIDKLGDKNFNGVLKQKELDVLVEVASLFLDEAERKLEKPQIKKLIEENKSLFSQLSILREKNKKLNLEKLDRLIARLDSLLGVSLEELLAVSKTFKDVKEKDWYYAYVMDLVGRGAINGYEDNTFKPNNTISLGEFLKISLSSANNKEYKSRANEHWAKQVYDEAVAMDILDEKDFPGTNENLDSPVNREDMSYILINISEKILGKEKEDTKGLESQISDYNNISEDRKDFVEQAFKKGLITGKENNEFDPKGSTTRAEASTVIIRLLQDK